MRLIVWGAGNIGGRVAALWAATGRPVLAFTKTTARHDSLRAAGVEPFTGPPFSVIRPDDHLLLALPGYMRQNIALLAVEQEQIPVPARVVLLNSVSYYTGYVGVVTANTPPGPNNRHIFGSGSSAELEEQFGAWVGRAKGRGVVLRLGGLYSATRGPFVALQRRGTLPPEIVPDTTLSLIHDEDAAQATFAALMHPKPKQAYLAVTPPCPSRAEFYTAACDKLDWPIPTFAPPSGQPPIIYDVTTLRRDLLPMPRYPDWHTIFDTELQDGV